MTVQGGRVPYLATLRVGPMLVQKMFHDGELHTCILAKAQDQNIIMGKVEGGISVLSRHGPLRWWGSNLTHIP
eukprot:9315167-Karenia_brevis.AAC.1